MKERKRESKENEKRKEERKKGRKKEKRKKKERKKESKKKEGIYMQSLNYGKDWWKSCGIFHHKGREFKSTQSLLKSTNVLLVVSMNDHSSELDWLAIALSN